jgi:hypothetical protein
MKHQTILLLLTCTCLSVRGAAQDTLGFCKGDKIPNERVIVGEFESPQCDPPDNKNAWDSAEPAEGINVCQSTISPDAGANVLQFVLCEKIDSEKCPLHKDGTTNAFVLRSPKECVQQKVVGDKKLDKAAKLRIVCATSKPPNDGTEVIIGDTDDKGCVGSSYFEGFKNALIQLHVDWSKPFVVCLDKHGTALNLVTNEYDVILRRFSDKNCPNLNELNAIVLWKGAGYRLGTSDSPEWTTMHPGIVFCDGSPWYSYLEETARRNISSQPQPQSRPRITREQAKNRRIVPGPPNLLAALQADFEHVYSENCGESSGQVNAMRVKSLAGLPEH